MHVQAHYEVRNLLHTIATSRATEQSWFALGQSWTICSLRKRAAWNWKGLEASSGNSHDQPSELELAGEQGPGPVNLYMNDGSS